MLLANTSTSQSFPKTRFALSLLAVMSFTFLLLSVSTSKPLLHSVIEADQQEFQKFVSEFGKSYSDSVYSTRFQAFRDNSVFIKKFNSEQNSVVLGINKFADMTFAEFKSIYLRPKTLAPKPEAQESELENFEALPSTVDWRTQNVLTPVKDQGHCGSCWAFSSTGAMEAAWAIKNSVVVSLSEQQLVACSGAYGNYGCDGGYAVAGFQYVIGNKGINTEANYPYLAVDSKCNTTLANVHEVTISKAGSVQAYNYMALQASVVSQPVSTGVEANIMWQLYQSGTLTSNCGVDINHDVLAVGYNTEGTIPYWIVKNSWGTDWGISGFIQIGMSAGSGVCGINMDAYYPIV